MVAVAHDSGYFEVGEQRMLLTGVSWGHFCSIARMFERDGVHVLLTYREGELELMSPGLLHEETKKVFARLIEAYADERDLNLNGHGAALFTQKAQARGAEPDECYSIGKCGKVPQMVLEIVYSRPKLDKLDVYRGLGVPEVWSYRRGVLSVHVLEKNRYVKRTKSPLLPELDLELLTSFVRPEEDQTPLVKAFRRALRDAASPKRA